MEKNCNVRVMARTRGLLKWIPIIFLTFTLLLALAIAQGSDASTTVSIGNFTSAPCETVTAPILISAVENYGTGTISITYDPAVVHVTGVSNGPESIGTAWNANNTIGFVGISAWNIAGVSGDIVFANVTFNAVGSAGSSTPLDLDVTTLKDTGYHNIPAAVNNGAFSIFVGPKPVIISVLQSNDSPKQGENVTITAHVTDNVGVTSVMLQYDTTEVAMTLDSGNETDGYWTTTIPGQPACTNLSINVTASDEAGNNATYGPHFKHWSDIEEPVIVSVVQSNDSPEQGEDVTIRAHVTDNVGVTSVTLQYDTTEVAMTLDSGNETDGYWNAIIPGQPACTNLSINVTASDEAGNNATYGPHFKHWVDTIPPEVTIISPEEGVTYATTSVDLIYTINELTRWAGYSLDGAENKTLIGNTTLEKLKNGLHNVTIYAEDLAGNVGFNTVNFRVVAVAPTISNIKVSPTYALPGTSINISADVFDSSGVRWVWAFIHKEGELVRTIFMSPSESEEDVYTGTWRTLIFTEAATYSVDIGVQLIVGVTRL